MAKKKKKFGRKLKRKVVVYAVFKSVDMAFEAWDNQVTRQKIRKIKKKFKLQ